MVSTPRNDLGELLAEHRRTARLSVRAAARRAGFSEGRWRQLESGYELRQGTKIPVNPKPITVLQAAEAVGLDPDQAFAAAGIVAVAENVRQIEKQAQDAKRDKEISPQVAGQSTGHVADTATAADTVAATVTPGTQSLKARLDGLDLDGLRRLRDMIDGAIYRAENPSIEEAVAAASVAFTEANLRSLAAEQRLRDAEKTRMSIERHPKPSPHLKTAIENEELFTNRFRNAQAERDEALVRYQRLRQKSETNEKPRGEIDAEHGETSER